MAEAARLVIDVHSRPCLARGVRLRRDKGRSRWVLLAPERVLTPDEIAVDVLKLCDGRCNIAGIAAALSQEYDAPVERIQRDVVELLQELADKGYVRA